jgi:ABC-type nitrate/sulfonate/bicarbonate transport system permease component
MAKRESVTPTASRPEPIGEHRPRALEQIAHSWGERLPARLQNKWVLRGLAWGALLLAWQVFALIKGPFYLPTVQDTLIDGMATLVSEGHLLTFARTLQQLFIGYGIACLIAIPVGAVMGLFRVMEDLLAPFVNTLFVTSLEALLPLLIIVFGTEFRFRVAIVVLFSVFFPLMNTAAGVRYVDRRLLETARAFNTPPIRLFTRVLLPAAAPSIVAGVRLGLGLALKGMVIAELWIISGTGGLLTHFGRFRQLDAYFALAILIVMVAVAMNQLLLVLQRRLQPWDRESRAIV